jgi:threonine aldolase
LRQAGVLAAACLVGLDEMQENLRVDHKNAKRLAEGIMKVGHDVVTVNISKTETNIVHMEIIDKEITATELIDRLKTVNLNLFV